MTETKPSIQEAIKKAADKRTAKETEEIVIPDYQKLYEEECAKTKALSTKVAEFEKLCKAYADRERQATETLQRATLEYNARTKYMMDCARHAFLSMQFAEAAANKDKGGNQ